MRTKTIFASLSLAFFCVFTACQQPLPPDEKTKVQTADTAMLLMADSTGSFALTAENGRATGPSVKYMPEWKALGWFRNKDKVEWRLSVPEDGEYIAELEWSVADEEAGKEFLLKTGQSELTGIVTPSGSWETYKTAAIGSLQLKKGEQSILFKANKDFDSTGALLDFRKIILKPESRQ